MILGLEYWTGSPASPPLLCHSPHHMKGRARTNNSYALLGEKGFVTKPNPALPPRTPFPRPSSCCGREGGDPPLNQGSCHCWTPPFVALRLGPHNFVVQYQGPNHLSHTYCTTAVQIDARQRDRTRNTRARSMATTNATTSCAGERGRDRHDADAAPAGCQHAE